MVNNINQYEQDTAEETTQYTLDDAQIEEYPPIVMSKEYPVNSTVEGIVTDIVVFQDKDWVNKKPLFTRTGKPKLKACITIMVTNHSDDKSCIGHLGGFFLNCHNQDWRNFVQGSKKQQAWDGKISNILREGVTVTYTYNGRETFDLDNGISVLRNSFTLRAYPDNKPDTKPQQVTSDKDNKQTILSLRANGMNDELIDKVLKLAPGTAEQVK